MTTGTGRRPAGGGVTDDELVTAIHLTGEAAVAMIDAHPLPVVVDERDLGVAVDNPTDQPSSVDADIPPTAKRARRRRRPTGAAPPLPRHIGASGKIWLAGAATLLVWMLAAIASPA